MFDTIYYHIKKKKKTHTQRNQITKITTQHSTTITAKSDIKFGFFHGKLTVKCTLKLFFLYLFTANITLSMQVCKKTAKNAAIQTAGRFYCDLFHISLQCKNIFLTMLNDKKIVDQLL